jgi:hypothetical protein
MNAELPIWDKIVNVFADKGQQLFLKEEIVDLVLQAYPETNPTSIIPSDYCYNLINKDPRSFQLQRFEFIRESKKYRWIGENFAYSGPIFWKAEQVGIWENGKWELWSDPRKDG